MILFIVNMNVALFDLSIDKSLKKEIIDEIENELEKEGSVEEKENYLFEESKNTLISTNFRLTIENKTLLSKNYIDDDRILLSAPFLLLVSPPPEL